MSLIGPNGAGKTTLLNLLTGQFRPIRGAIACRGREISALRPHERARLGFGRTFGISQTLVSMSVLENAMIGAFLKERDTAMAADTAFAALQLVGLDHHAERRSGELTLGERWRLEFVRAIALVPERILLDEVMAGLNQTEVQQVYDLVHRLNGERATFLVIEHDLKVVRAISRRVLVLDRGRLLAEGTAEAVLADPTVIEACVGTSAA